MEGNKAKKAGLKILRIMGWIVLSVIALLLIVIGAVQIPWVQNKIKQEAVGFLQDKIGTPVSLEHFSLSFPKKIVIEGLYLEDQQRDTLLYAGRVGVDTDLWGLMDNTIELNTIELENIVGTIKRSATDSAFNFDYIIAAFDSGEPTPADTSATPWTFRLGDVEIDGIRLHLNDSVSGNQLDLALSKFDLSTDVFDLDAGEILFDEIAVQGLRTNLVQFRMSESLPDSTEIVPEDSTAVALNIGFRRLALRDIRADWNQKILGQVLRLDLPEAVVKADTIDIKKQQINLTSIEISEPFISFQQFESATPAPEPTPVTSPQEKAKDQEPWNITLQTFDITGARIHYFDGNGVQQGDGVDFADLMFSNFNLGIRNVLYNGSEAYADVSRFSFREKSGFAIRSFETTVALLRDSMAVKGFALETTNSRIRMNASATYPSLTAATEDLGSVNGVFRIASTSISLKDVLFLAPTLLDSLPLTLPQTTTIGVDALAHGSVKKVFLDHLQLHTLESTSLFANGSITSVMDSINRLIDFKVDRLYTTRSDIRTVLADSLIPASIEIPKWIRVDMAYHGTLQTPNVKANLETDLGSVQLDAEANLAANIKENYRGEVRILDFNMGELLKQPQQMGNLDMVAAVNGKGLTIEELDALVKVRVNKFQYNGYTYRDFRIDGAMKEYFFEGKAGLADENLNFTLTADLDYKNDVPSYALLLDLKNADFNQLKLTPRPLRARGKLEVDLATADFQRINGDIGIRDFAIYNGDALYAVDSLLFASIDQEGRSEISIRSDIVSGDFKGTINIFELPDLLSRHFNQYFSLRDTVYAKPVEEQRFRFDLVIKNTDLLTEVLLPDLEPFVPGEISGEFDSALDKLVLNINLSEIKYGGVAFDSVYLKALSDAKSFDFTFALQNIFFDTLNIKSLRLAGNVMHDSIRTNLSILDSLNREKYYLGGVFHSFEDAFQFSFLKNQLTLNYEEWQTPLYNTLRFTDSGLDPNNFYIAREQQRILLYKKNNADSTLSIAFREVELSNVTSLVEGTTPLSGIIDGELTLASSAESSFETDLRISKLAILERLWGDLVLNVNKKGNAPTNFKLNIDGDDAELRADGFLTSDEDPRISVRANIPRLNLAIVEPFTMGQLREMKGMLTGQFRMEGRTADPDMSGSVNFKDASFISTFANSAFSLPNETIYLRDDQLVFDRFNIFDNRKNKATIDGMVSSREAGGFDLKLNLTANQFQLLNTTEKDNELFYGDIRLNTRTAITGTSSAPVVNMNVSLAENSHLTYVIPQSEAAILEQKGVVVFVDRDQVNDPFMKGIDPRDSLDSGFTGIDLTANIELDGTETFNVVIDPVTGDRLSVQGTSNLTLHMDPTGDMQLTGRYEIRSGTYDLSFARFVKRNFQIARGSTMTWSGDIMNADMDIRAIYEVETSPVDLVANQVLEEELPMYKKLAPFQVFLILKGELLSPEISFQLSMPERQRGEYGGAVYAKLQDLNTREADLNKQVFALLVLKRFISDNPFDSQGGGGFESTARKSVSRILSDQLNKLSSNIEGVELSFDVKSYEDYSGGAGSNQTDLELGVSKSLMNDRLVVKVSGNVNIEGENSQQNSFTDFIGDLALEYKLTEDGRIRVTGFRNNNYDMINGEVIETGAGVIYIKDYDSLRELFKANETKRE